MSLRRRDVEQWMSHRRLPVELRRFFFVFMMSFLFLFGDYLYAQNVLCRQIWEAERFNWAATRGVNEEMLMETLPEDLQRDIRRHLFKFVKKASFLQKLIQLKLYWFSSNLDDF